MEKHARELKRGLERNKNRLTYFVAVTSLLLLIAACSPGVRSVDSYPTATSTRFPTAVVLPTSTETPPSPTATLTQTIPPSSATATLGLPTGTPTSPKEKIKPIGSEPKFTCKYYSGSSSFDRMARQIYKDYVGEKNFDDSKGYTVITLKETSGNMTIFITQEGSMVSFVRNFLLNQDNLKLLPCNPENVTDISILTGGNNETNGDKANVIAGQLTSVSGDLATTYSHADVSVYLPYVTQADDSDTIKTKNNVDREVMANLKGVKRISVFPLTPRVLLNGAINSGLFMDPWHVWPRVLIDWLGGRTKIFPTLSSKN